MRKYLLIAITWLITTPVFSSDDYYVPKKWGMEIGWGDVYIDNDSWDGSLLGLANERGKLIFYNGEILNKMHNF